MRRGRKYRIDLLTKMKIEIIIENVEKIVNTIINEAQTGSIGDGKYSLYLRRYDLHKRIIKRTNFKQA